MYSLLQKHLNGIAASAQFELCCFSEGKPVETIHVNWPEKSGKSIDVEFAEGRWALTVKAGKVSDRSDALDISFALKLVEGVSVDITVSMLLDCKAWGTQNYILMPSAAYDGNRFESRNLSYPPQLHNSADIGSDKPIIITDVPRLNNQPGPSRLQQMTRDLATPALGIHFAEQSTGFWLLTDQATSLGDSCFDVEEAANRNRAVVRLTAPGYRLDKQYVGCGVKKLSEDKPATFSLGDELNLRARLFVFDCPTRQGLFNRFMEIRKDLTGPVNFRHELPFSAAWKIQEKKFNSDNWYEEGEFYAPVVKQHSNLWPWRIGWCGGLMTTLPLLFEGDDLSRQRAKKTFNFVFPNGQSPSGFFYSCGDGHKWGGIYLGGPGKEHRHLIRRSGDALYFAIKQFMLLKKQTSDNLPEHWLQGAKRCADAFIRLWDRYGQFGQFVDLRNGEIIIGGSTAGAVVPAALALASRFFNEKDYLRVAREAVTAYYNKDMKNGVTTGGPAEILQCPDSESAFALLESFVVLYEVTGDSAWIRMAEEMACQCATWCVSYDFKFPSATLFGKMDMRAAGAVWANVQNKHGAPGICTFSGDSLFKLYRATGNELYLDLIREIAHNITQYLSREDRPVGEGMFPGWMTERVNLSDWAEGTGEIFPGSCWCETSCMLTNIEIPGLYIQPDKGRVFAIDNIDAEAVKMDSGKLAVKVTNPTDFDAEIKMLVENSTETVKPLGQNFLFACQKLELASTSTKIIELEIMLRK